MSKIYNVLYILWYTVQVMFISSSFQSVLGANELIFFLDFSTVFTDDLVKSSVDQM